nr:hypothetical protein [Tanacetum cinerariifolium]
MARLQFCDYHNMVAILEKGEFNSDFHPMVDFIAASPLSNTIMARLQFCDYHNMVAILEKSEHNVDFHPMVDFIEASPLRYALTVKPTVYVSHIRQFWSTARIETTEEGTKILATVDGILRIVTESSLRRNLKLKDEDGISSLPDTELFENLTLMGYNISSNQKFTFQKGQFSHQWKYLIHTIMQCLSPKSIGFNEFSSNIATALVCLATNRTYNFSKMIFEGLVKNVNNKGEGSDTPTEPHHTPSPEAQPTSHTTHSSSTLPPITTTSIPTVTSSEITPIWQYTRRARIAQSFALLTIADEPASPLRNVTPRVTSPAANEGSMQQTINELTALCTSLQRQYSELAVKFEAHEIEITRLKVRVKLLEDRAGEAAEGSRDDAPIKGRKLDEGAAAAERASDDTKEMETVLTSIDAATVLASGAAEVPTGSGYIPTAGPPAAKVPTGSDVVPTASGHSIQKKKRQRSHGKDFRGMTFKEVEAKFNSVWKQMEDFIPMGSKEEAERIKRKGLSLEQESAKKQKTLEEVTKEAKSSDEVPKEKVKEMMHLVPIKEVYVEALQVKHRIIDWKVHTEGQRSYWKITRLGGSSASYQFFIDLLKHLDREDLNQLWRLVKETLNNRPPTSDKEMELWVELCRLYEPDDEDQLLTHTQNLMHAPVENYSRMVNDLILKIYKIASTPRQQGIEFPLAEEVPTASEEGCHCQKKREATARKIALLSKSVKVK